ncbi:hypothetical protein GGX14DRAFT_384229 [Mycena pura]|uniref:Uncharacterized protein n=1 Tax=Mycena pura TaxID=153505 RepID=A0AAD6YUW6_9AGAR|nr:hypothetical protein GGX14DRAFT_384229 [Mycena pura]
MIIIVTRLLPEQLQLPDTKCIRQAQWDQADAIQFRIQGFLPELRWKAFQYVRERVSCSIHNKFRAGSYAREYGRCSVVRKKESPGAWPSLNSEMRTHSAPMSLAAEGTSLRIAAHHSFLSSSALALRAPRRRSRGCRLQHYTTEHETGTKEDIAEGVRPDPHRSRARRLQLPSAARHLPGNAQCAPTGQEMRADEYTNLLVGAAFLELGAEDAAQR